MMDFGIYPRWWFIVLMWFSERYLLKFLYEFCWWSLWILFVLFGFAWIREVCSIINPAKIGMILKLSMPPESNQMIKGTSLDHSISILDVTALIPTCEIPGLVLKLKIWRPRSFDWRSWTHILCSFIYFATLFALVSWASTIQFLDSQKSL